MPMRGNITFVPTSSNSGATLIALEDIPEDVVQGVEEVYAALKSAAGRMRAEFDSKAEAIQWMRQAQAYCAQRPDGAIRFRKSPTPKLADNVIEFRITDLDTKEEEPPTSTPIVEATPAKVAKAVRK